MKQPQKRNSDSKQISLMTLLAYEATSDARKILKKYNQPDAVNKKDLEVKLAQLYFSIDDKIAFEKELAKIHPHSKWILTRTNPTPSKKEDSKTVDQIKDEVIDKESKTSQFDKRDERLSELHYMNHQYCANMRCPIHAPNDYYMLGFDAMHTNIKKDQTQTSPIAKSSNDYVGLIGLVAVIGIAFYVISKSNTNKI